MRRYTHPIPYPKCRTLRTTRTHSEVGEDLLARLLAGHCSVSTDLPWCAAEPLATAAAVTELLLEGSECAPLRDHPTCQVGGQSKTEAVPNGSEKATGL